MKIESGLVDLETYSPEDFNLQEFEYLEGFGSFYLSEERIILFIFVTVSLVLSFTFDRAGKASSTITEDMILYKPKWMENWNLGIRRIFSIITNICVVLMVTGSIFLIANYIFNYPGILRGGLLGTNLNEFFWGSTAITAIVYIGLYFVSGTVNWVVRGFSPR